MGPAMRVLGFRGLGLRVFKVYNLGAEKVFALLLTDKRQKKTVILVYIGAQSIRTQILLGWCSGFRGFLINVSIPPPSRFC